MSTRSTTHFCYGESTEAIVYRHSDGYPEGAGKDLIRFLETCRDTLKDTRLNDPTFLAAKYVVFLAREFNYSFNENRERVPNDNPFDFLSVGVCMQDPGDIEYRYLVDCSNIGPDTKLPRVVCQDVSQHWGTDEPPDYAEVPIPDYTPHAKLARDAEGRPLTGRPDFVIGG
jgi:hypothetical protein